MDDKFIIAIVGLLAAILGGSIQALTSSRNQQREMAWRAKWDLYAAYFESLGDLSFYPPKSEKHVSALAAMAQIRARIAIYGSSNVVHAVSEVFKFRDLNSEAAQLAMSVALHAMRKDVGQAVGLVSTTELKNLMFNQRDEQ